MTFPSTIPMLINGEFVSGEAKRSVPLCDPASNETLSHISFASPAQVNQAVASAVAALPDWSNTPVPARARIMLRYQALLKQHQEEIATIICQELGKNFEDAMGDVWRGIEVVEHACNVCSLMMGETVENVAKDIDTLSIKQPIGVCLGITPFNFPAMIPLWMFPLANASGNTFVLKPSEQDPMTSVRLIELYLEAGAPKNIIQLVHGDKDVVNQLLIHENISAVSFVGSIDVGKHIYKTATDNFKRVQCMTGAKNHCVVMPDAHKTQLVNAAIGAAFGAAGQRCMASSVLVMVGQAQDWIDDIVAAAKGISPGHWQNSNAAYGPQISAAAKARIISTIEAGKAEGALCVLDGSEVKVDGYPDGHWVGPTIFTHVTPEMRVYQEEIFGPVLCIVNVDTLDDAISLINRDHRGNGTALFTSSGRAARKFQHEINVGQVGINVPIPVPLPFFSFTGWRGSFLGDLHAYGKQAVQFYTETKTVISRWFEDDTTDHLSEQQEHKPNMSINLR